MCPLVCSLTVQETSSHLLMGTLRTVLTSGLFSLTLPNQDQPYTGYIGESRGGDTGYWL